MIQNLQKIVNIYFLLFFMELIEVYVEKCRNLYKNIEMICGYSI